MSLVQFHGPPCLLHSNYVFYKAFKYKYQETWRILNIGDFFFAKIVQEMYDCICETELLWEDKATCQILVSVRLYARPEHTTGGRQDDTGRDEVIALGERLVLRLDDLVQLIQHDVKWTYGCPTFCSTKRAPTNGDVGGDDHDQEVQRIMENDQEVQGSMKTDKSKVCGGSLNGVVRHNGLGKKRPLDDLRTDNSAGENEAVSGAVNVAVMSYPRYCRYRALQKRLEDCTDQWIHVAAVVAIGGFSGKYPGCRVMFCRDTFYQAEIDDLDIRMDHMLPVLKGCGKGKKSRQLSRKDSQQDSDSTDELFVGVTPSISTSSRPRRLTESSEVSDDKVSTEEQAFLIGLHKFMHEANMPIGRIPSLGFKQNLYSFYKQAEQLGGYDSITHKRMWKHLYDKLGGNSSNTGAATCTRKHYERLLLPYERHLRKLNVRQGKKTHQKQLPVHVSEDKVDGGFVEGIKHEDLKVEPKLEVKEEVMEPCVKENVRQSGSENLKYSQNESTTSCTDQVEPEAMAHSKPDPLVESEASGMIPIPGLHVHKENVSSYVQVKDGDGTGRTQQLSFSQVEKLHQKLDQKVPSAPSAVGDGHAKVPSAPSAMGDSHAVSGIVYRGSYLMPVIPQMLHSPWGMLDPSSPSSAPTDFTRPHSVSAFKDPQGAPFHSSTKMNHHFSSNDIYPNSSGVKPTHSTSNPHKPSSSSCSSSSGVLKAAHTNMPYKPSPYLLNDHIQPTRKCSQSFRHLGLADSIGNSSQSLAALLHPTPPGHRSLLQLPPAPFIIYLHPSSVSPSHLSPITSAPPTAHCNPRKRVYPFDSPTNTATNAATAAAAPMMSMFPSPDMVLHQIRNSTGLPRIGSTSRLPSTRQQYEDPKKILAQAMPTSDGVWFPHREEPHHHPELTVSKQSTSKARNSRKNQQAYSVYGQLPSSDLRHSLLQPGHIIPSSKTKVPDQSKPAGSVNGLVAAQQPMKSVQQQPMKSLPSVIQASPVTSSIKDGRLTSALFGAQFTALPRQAKPSELPPAPTADSACATAAALSLNPHLHPAFMSPFLPSATTATPAGLSTQLQMLAGSYAAPSQLAAYEEMLRQNGYSAYLAAAAQGKLSKKN